jgi:predicted short-subunit dehydrogenase-like oxidoreductase (DUF2520 family)
MPVAAVAGRDRCRTEQAARFIGGDIIPTSINELARTVSRVVVATSDDRIGPAAEQLATAGFHSGEALHTCGAQPPDALRRLRDRGTHVGLLHPLQTIPNPEKGVTDLPGIPFGIAGDPRAVAWAREIAALLQGVEVHVDPDHISLYHAAAVMASGGLLAVVHAASAMMRSAGIDSDSSLRAIERLCRTTLTNAFESEPAAVLTGPIVRGNVETVAAHLRALSTAPDELRNFYLAVSRVLLELAQQRGLPDASRKEIQATIDRESGSGR